MEDAIGTPLGKEYYLNVRGVWMKMPYGYFDPWPNRKLKEAVPGTPEAAELPVGTGIDFAFWMPTLRWPERNTMSVPSFRPCEDGRRRPQDGEYVVRAALLWPWLPDRVVGGHKTPNEQFSNALKYLGLKPVAREHDLTRLENPNGKGLIYFHAALPTDPEFLIACTRLGSNPLCVGDAWWPAENLGIYVNFSIKDLPRWRANIEAARMLVMRWRENALK